jgi:hypothetical protein
MREFVGNQSQTLLRPWGKPPFIEDNVIPQDESVSVYCPGRLNGVRIGMNPYMREIESEPRLHERADVGFQRTSGRPKNVVDDCRRSTRIGRPGSFTP